MKQRRKTKSAFKTRDITLQIDEIGAGGDGIGTFEGLAVYVPKTMTGDIAQVRLEKKTAQGYAGRLLSLETPSPERIDAICPHFADCGGCELQHLSQQSYRTWKIHKVQTILERAKIKPKTMEEPVFIDQGTRRRTTLAVLKTAQSLHLGYHAPRSHQITSIKSCAILDTQLEQIITGLPQFLNIIAPQGTPLSVMLQVAGGGVDMMLGGEWAEGRGFTLAQNEALAQMAHALDIARISMRAGEHSATEILLVRKPIIKDFADLRVALPPVPFLQASDAGEDALIAAVREYTGDAQNIADLFCGCGTFTGALLDRAQQIYAADSDRDAITALQATKHPKLSAQARNLFQEPLSSKELSAFDAIILDPPRAGAYEQVRSIAYSDAPRVIMVSCNPASFARDAKVLMEDGDFSCKSMRVIDQFTWSSHAEIVGLFTR